MKILFLAIFIGVVTGVFSSSFLYSLSYVTNLRGQFHLLIWGLPFFGFLFGLLLTKIPHHINQGVPHLLDHMDGEENQISPWMTPYIFLSSLGTHLFGGSAGREGVGLIMGAGVSRLLPLFRKDFEEMRTHLIYAGLAAGFASIFGTPWAALAFAFELHHFKYIRRFDIIVSTFIASIVGYQCTHFLGPEHQSFAVNFTFDWQLPVYLLIAVLTSALGAHLFYWGLKGYTRIISKMIPNQPWKLAIGGLLVSALVSLTNGYDYIGIGTDVITKSFLQAMSPSDFLFKALFTIMTLSVGFKGGEVTPLFFMGATFSNSIANLFLMRNFALSSSLGMVSLLGAVAGAPLASGILGFELFGWEVGILCLITSTLATMCMRGHRLYRH